MAWTTPRTWVANEILTAALLNTHLRDNLNFLYPTKTIPSKMIAYLNDVVANIPSGWSELTAARGRTIVGMPASGTLAGTVGTALTDLQDKTHTHTSASHEHSQKMDAATGNAGGVEVVASSSSGAKVYTSNGGGTHAQLQTGVNSTTPGATGTAATSDVIPYIQYVAMVAA